MKTHIIFLSLTALLFVSCASKESRDIASTKETPEQQKEYSKVEGYSGRDYSKQ